MKNVILVGALLALLIPTFASANGSYRAACGFFDKCLQGELTVEEHDAYTEYLATKQPINYELVALKIKLRELKELRVKLILDLTKNQFGITSDEIKKALGL